MFFPDNLERTVDYLDGNYRSNLLPKIKKNNINNPKIL